MQKCIKTKDLFKTQNEYLKPLFQESIYPWDIIPKINEYIQMVFKSRIKGYFFMDDDILMGENVRISPLAVIKGPAIIGANTEIRAGAYLSGNTIIGENCVIGNSTELKNCVLCDGVELPRYNYVGNSVLGQNVYLGAGTVCSDRNSNGLNVVIRCEPNYITDLKKLGAIIGDNVDIDCGCVLNSGTVIGKETRVYPLNSLCGVYPEKVIIKSNNDVVEIK